MTTPTFTTTDIVNFAAEKDAVKITSAFNELIGQRVLDAVQARKNEIAQGMFNPQAESQEMNMEVDAQPAEEPVAAEAQPSTEGQEVNAQATDAEPAVEEPAEPIVASAEEQPKEETEAA